MYTQKMSFVQFASRAIICYFEKKEKSFFANEFNFHQRILSKEATLYDQFNLTDYISCKMTNLYFENDQPLNTKF